MRRFLLFLGVLLLAIASCSNGDKLEFVFTLRCLQGEGDSLNETRKDCYKEAQSQAVEQAGDKLEAFQESWGYQLSRDEVRSVAVTLVQTKIIEERIERLKESNALSLTIKAWISLRKAREHLDGLAAVKKLSGSSQAVKAPVPAKASSAKKSLGSSSLPQPVPDRPSGFKESLEVKPLPEHAPGRPPTPVASAPVVTPSTGQGQIRPSIESLVKGMTPMDVEAIMGPAEAIKQNELDNVVYECRLHAGYWVVFRWGMLECIKTRLEYRATMGGDCHCQGLSMNFFLR